MPEAVASNPTSLVLAVVVLIQLGVFGWVFKAGGAKNELATLSRLVGELASTVAALSIAVARGEANDANHTAHLNDISGRLEGIASEFRRGSRGVTA